MISELAASHPDRIIHKSEWTDLEVDGDHDRLGQVFSNLIGNALMHGDPNEPVSIALVRDGENLVFRTVNMGDTIPPEAMEQLFQPFSRGEVRSSLQGLGLGLYISAQIAAAHDGTLSAVSANGKTTFTFELPPE